ncbi:MAG: hypothetical protein DRJ03_29235, partial [Chloroflexi bacterium]
KGKFKKAQTVAPTMSTSDRVDEFGNEKIKAIFISMDLESFQQEYECHHIDETVSFYPLSLINRCAFTKITDDIFLEEDEYVEDYEKPPIEKRYPKIKFTCHDNIDDMIAAMNKGIIKGPLHGGFDVGRRKHGAEFIMAEDAPDGPAIVRGHICFNGSDFEAMESELGRAIEQLNLHSLKIDETGMGIELAENMTKRYPGVAEGVIFTNMWKQESATHVRRLMEVQELAFPNERRMKSQIHSIKRVVSDHGNLRFDAEKNKEHHGDILWAIAMAVEDLREFDSGSIDVAHAAEETKIPTRIIKRPVKRLIQISAPSVRVLPGSALLDPTKLPPL